MSVRVMHVGLSSLRRGRSRTIREVAAVVSFQPRIYSKIRRAARQTNLPIGQYVQEVLEADLATRRLTSPSLPSAKTATESRQ